MKDSLAGCSVCLVSAFCFMAVGSYFDHQNIVKKNNLSAIAEIPKAEASKWWLVGDVPVSKVIFDAVCDSSVCSFSQRGAAGGHCNHYFIFNTCIILLFFPPLLRSALVLWSTLWFLSWGAIQIKILLTLLYHKGLFFHHFRNYQRFCYCYGL